MASSASSSSHGAAGSRRKADKNGGRGPTQKEFEREAESHADRAARLLARAKELAGVHGKGVQPNAEAAAAATSLGKPMRKAASAPNEERTDVSDAPIPLPMLLKSLVNPSLGSLTFTVKEAIPLAGKLVRAKLNTQTRLSHLNAPVLDDAGITGEQDKHKILIAFGVRQAGSSASNAGGGGAPSLAKRSANALTGSQSSPQSKRRRAAMDDEALSREYGNVVKPQTEPGLGGEQMEYEFHEVLEEGAVRGRYAFVNRAPIMTAWTTLVLERLGFQRREALSIAHCYVNTTSTARGISLGIIPASERDRSVHVIGSNQPHFELMGVKVPLMKLHQTDEWRGISAGQVIGPDQAFNYMRRSMHQTLPLVIGALTLLADSYVNATSLDVKRESTSAEGQLEDAADVASPDLLHARAYDLYTQFRPETAGEWGKKSQFYCSKALALRRGHEDELLAWDARQDGEQLEAQQFEQDLQAFVAAQQEQGNSNLRIDGDESESKQDIKREEDNDTLTTSNVKIEG